MTPRKTAKPKPIEHLTAEHEERLLLASLSVLEHTMTDSASTPQDRARTSAEIRQIAKRLRELADRDFVADDDPIAAINSEHWGPCNGTTQARGPTQRIRATLHTMPIRPTARHAHRLPQLWTAHHREEMEMTGKAQRKGDRAEREAAALLTEELGYPVRRKLGAGRTDDEGDLEGLPALTIQVCDWQALAQAVRIKPLEADTQRRNAGNPYAVTLIRLRGGEYRAVMTIQQFADLYREATA